MSVCKLICPTSAAREFLSILARENISGFRNRKWMYGWRIPPLLQQPRNQLLILIVAAR